jgi:heparin/heparan-sulfate lyase
MGSPDPVDAEVLEYMPLVGRRYRDGLARSWSDWLLTESEAKAKAGDRYALDGHKFWPYVLWYDPQLPLVKPEDLPLAHVFRGFGWVSTRSSWKEDATFALFICSPTWFGGHQHCDNNSFIIHKYAPLALDTGVYDTAQGHRANYFARTIAHNTVTVFDPEEKATGGDWGGDTSRPVTNDGGQVYMGTPEVGGEVGPATPFDRSDLLAYELTDQYTYAAGDATKAYAKSKLAEFTRAFLHLRADLFVVFDRVESTNPAFKKRWLLHSVNEAEVSGATFTITNGPGRLWGKTLLPQEVTCESIGGPGKEFWVDGKNWPPQQAVRDDTGRWRLEVSPAKPATRDYFLHVLYACSSDTTTYPAADAAQTDAQVTATIKHDGTTYRVTFSKTGALTGSVRIVGADGKVLLDRPLATKVLLDKQE